MAKLEREFKRRARPARYPERAHGGWRQIVETRFSSFHLVLVAVAVLASASSAQEPRALPVADGQRDFRLSPGDVIQVRFFYNSELDDTIEVRPDGMISMPFLGEMKIDGMTVTELRERLEDQYLPILKQPAITVQVRQYASQKVYVGGQVLRPGVVPLKGEMTLLDAIMEAGGQRTTGSDTEVVLIRKSPQGQAVRYDLFLKPKTQEEPAAGDVRLQPFDVILIPETRIARIDRWVDEHVRQLIPLTLTAGFTYLTSSGGTVVIPRD
jgi:protein involved in polysaccharide export with SLBB domain